MSIDATFRPTFTDLRAEIERRVAQGVPSEEIAALVDQFLGLGGADPAPLIEYDGTVTWLYRDAAAENVSVIGDIIGYDPDKTRMSKVAGSDLFYFTAQVPLDTRMEYLFVVDNPLPADESEVVWSDWLRRCRVDPLNGRQILKIRPLRMFSVLEMPGARPMTDLDSTNAVAGSMSFHVVGSSALNIWRRVWVCLPPGYDRESRRYPTLYLNNGEAYLLSARAPQIADVLLAQNEIVPIILVLLQGQEISGVEPQLDERFVSFLADHLVPWVDERFATSSDPRERVIGGAGFGATLSLYAALQRPDVFGCVLAQSPDMSSLADQLPAQLEQNKSRGFGPPQCYVDVGRYESIANLEDVQSLCTTLLSNEATLSYQDFSGDGSFLGWRTTLPDALRFHFGTSPFLPEL